MFGLPLSASVTKPPAPLPDPKLRQSDPEKYWRRVRDEQFLLPNWRAFLNNGSLGIAPRPVVKTVTDFIVRSAGLEMDWYPRWGYETMDEHRQELADFYGCKKDELALTHNATEALSMLANGIDLKDGDEVVMTDQEHPSGRGPWQLRAARHPITLREVKIPTPPQDPGQLADLLISSIGPKTRVLAFSGILSPTGYVMPVKEICAAARAKGVITIVDGAHMHGQIPFKTAELNADYVVGSPHKWAYAPAGCGLLYIREENLERLWPTICTGTWNQKDLKAARFMGFGTNNRAIMEGMIAGLRFLKDLGPEAVYARIHTLGKHYCERAKQSKHVELLTPMDDRMYGSLVAVRFKSDKLDAFHDVLKKKRIWVNMAKQIRLSAHIHTRPQDIDLYFDIMDHTLANT